MKRLVSLFLAVLMLTASFAMAEAPEGYPEIVPGIDFGGQTVTIYDFWGGSPRVDEPSEEQQARYDYEDWLMKTYNVVIEQKAGGDWGTIGEAMINFVSAPDGSLRAYIIDAGKVGSLMRNGIAAPINYDLSGEEWNSANIAMWSKNGQAYAMSKGSHEPRICLFFNKRVLSEVGIDWNTLYDMQAAGTWTWEAFEEMLQKVHRDVDNDGVVDIWGLTGDHNNLHTIAIATNGAAFFATDAEGKLQPAMGTEEAITAMNWSRSILQTYFFRQPANATWDYFKDAFKSGQAAFLIFEAYGGYNDNADLHGMEDEWGCVAFPVAKEGGNYVTNINENSYLIPNVYTEDVNAKIAFIVDMWTKPTPGYDDEFGWVGNKYNYTDERAVDETYAMLRNPAHGWADLTYLLGTNHDVLGNSLLWVLGNNSTPAQLVEAGMPAWQAMCDTFNGN